jgi:hypothetical protein
MDARSSQVAICNESVNTYFIFMVQFWRASFKAGHTIMSISGVSGVSGFAAVSAPQQALNQAQGAQTKQTLQPDPAVRKGESHHHHHAGSAAPVQPGNAGQAAGSTGIDTLA